MEELFREDGCLSCEGLHALMEGRLDELGRLEAAEHLAYCDHCMDRYTALLTADVLEPAPRSVRGAVMTTIWVRIMQNTYGRIAVAGVAAVLALTMWRSGTLNEILVHENRLDVWTPPAESTQQLLPGKTDGKEPSDREADAPLPGRDERPMSLYEKFSNSLDGLTGRQPAGEAGDGQETPQTHSLLDLLRKEE